MPVQTAQKCGHRRVVLCGPFVGPLFALVAGGLISGCQQAPIAPMPEQPSMMAVTPVNFMADDGVTVSGRYYLATKPKALILLFHQANSSKDEYATIAPRLVEMGYSALAIDQRSGGAMFGFNQTAARTAAPASYGDALHDLEAALDWSSSMRLPVILWGSSYSAALVIELAAKRPREITGVLAFSPGQYLGPGNAVMRAAAKVRAPTFVTSSGDAAERSAAKAIFDAVPASGKTLYVPTAGLHGSSMLIASKVPQGATANWVAVSEFLRKISDTPTG